MDEAERRLLENIRRYDYHIVVVGAADTPSPFAHTVGLFHRFHHPEIVVVGLGEDRLVDILTHVAEEVRGGERFEAKKTYDDVLEAHDCTFRRVAARHFATHLARALWYYDGFPFPALQLVWPDADGRYPWQSRVVRGLKQLQPVLER
jgi:hypothetical protein